MSSVQLMNRIAETDITFVHEGRTWVGKCLICNTRLRYDAVTGEGANVEHIVPRSLGGTNNLLNLGITHQDCNAEKGRHWDNSQSRRRDPEKYQRLVERLLAERVRRWHEPGELEAAHDAKR